MSDSSPELDDWGLSSLRGEPPNLTRRLKWIALLYAHRAIAASTLALPPSLWISGHLSAFPNPLGQLIQPGALLWADLYRLMRSLLAAYILQSSLAAIFLALLGLFPFACLITSFIQQRPLPLRTVLARATSSIPTLTLLWGTSLLLQTSLCGLVLLIGEQVLSLFTIAYKTADQLRIALIVTALLAHSAISVIHDLARIFAIADAHGFYTSASRAIAAFQRNPATLFWAYTYRALVSLILLISAALITWPQPEQSLHRTIIAALVTQSAVFFAVLIRASWLSRAAAYLSLQSR